MTDIFSAIRANDATKLRNILAANPEAINEQYKSNLNWLPIHFATDCNADMEIFDILFEFNADINSPEANNHRNVFEIALKSFPMAKIEHFISLGAKPHPKSYSIWWAALNPDADVIRYLLDQGDSLDCVSKSDTPAVFAAVRNTNADILRILIEHGADLSGEDWHQLKIIHYAAKNGSNPEVIKLLLENGFNINEPDRYGMTPLHHAAGSKQSVKMVKALLSMGADPLKEAPDIEKPSAIADSKEKKEILRLAEWVAQGKDPAKLPKKKRRPLPMPKTAPKPLKLERVELVNEKENINDCPLPEKARFAKDCAPELLGYTDPDQTPDLSNSYRLVYTIRSQ